MRVLMSVSAGAIILCGLAFGVAAGLRIDDSTVALLSGVFVGAVCASPTVAMLTWLAARSRPASAMSATSVTSATSADPQHELTALGYYIAGQSDATLAGSKPMPDGIEYVLHPNTFIWRTLEMARQVRLSAWSLQADQSGTHVVARVRPAGADLALTPAHSAQPAPVVVIVTGSVARNPEQVIDVVAREVHADRSTALAMWRSGQVQVVRQGGQR